jgi:hypothetical protein
MFELVSTAIGLMAMAAILWAGYDLHRNLIGK